MSERWSSSQNGLHLLQSRKAPSQPVATKRKNIIDLNIGCCCCKFLLTGPKDTWLSLWKNKQSRLSHVKWKGAVFPFDDEPLENVVLWVILLRRNSQNSNSTSGEHIPTSQTALITLSWIHTWRREHWTHTERLIWPVNLRSLIQRLNLMWAVSAWFLTLESYRLYSPQ